MKAAHPASNCIVRLFIVLPVMAGLVLAGAASGASAQSQTGFTYNGVAYTSYQSNEYLETPQGPDGTAAMAAYGVDYATVLATQYVQTSTSTTIAPDSSTPTDAAVVAAITNLQNSGIKVVLKPQVDSLDGIWRGEFEPTNTAAWFASYQTFIVHYATIAQAQGVDVFVVGCEFATLSGSAYQSNWDTIIAAVRAVYTGPLAYAANATSAGDEFTKVSFWPKLDIIGVDGYFPLTNHADPTLAQLVNAWTIPADNKNGFAPATALKNFQASVINAQTNTTMPLIFTEIGYTSTAGTNEAPYNYTPTGTFDPTEQANCYQAFFEVFSQQSSWMKGVFWWDWSVSAPGANDTGYSPQNKLAGDVLAYWYGGQNFTLAPTASTLSVTQGSNATDTITVTPADGFTGTVTLAATGLPAGVTAAFATNPATSTSVLTLTAGSTATTGAATVTVTGTSATGTLTTFTTIALTITASSAPSFTLSASPGSVTVIQGNSNTSTVTVNPVDGFTSAVTLAATGLPTGVTAAFATNPTTGSSVLTLTAGSTATAGPATVTITGTSGALTASTTIALTVNVPPSFTLSASPGSVTVIQGNSATDTITVTGAGGFSGPVALSAAGLPGGVTASFAPGTGSGTQVLTLTASGTATVGGPVTVTVNGTTLYPGGPPSCGIPCNLTASTTIALTVNVPPSFTLSPSAPTLSVTQGSSATDTITVTGAGGFSAPVGLSAAGLPSGVTASFGAGTSSMLTLTASSTATVGGPVTVTINGTTLYPGGPPSCGIPCNLTASTTIALTVDAAPTPSFTLSASPASLSVAQGGSGTSTISVTDVGGFTGSVALAASGLPSGVTAAFATNPATGASVLTLTASNTTTTGAATITITGTSGALTAAASVALTITAEPSFIFSGPAITVAPGAATGNTSTIAVAPTNGFTGTVNLSCSISPAAASDPATCTLSPASVTLTGSMAQLSTLTVTTTAATSAENRTKRPFWPSAGGAALALLLFFGIPRRRRNWLAMLGLLVIFVSLSAMGCGGSSGSGGGGGNSGTTPGTYTVTVTGASGTTTETGTVSLTVQ